MAVIPPKYEPDRVFVGGLPSTCDSSEKLHAFFIQFGPIKKAEAHSDPLTGKCKGFGFITFESPESVEKAIFNDSWNIIDNKWVNVKRCVAGGSAGDQSAKWTGAPNSCEDAGLWLKGLPLDSTEFTLRQFFEQFGTVVDACVLPSKFPNNPDRAGLVRMASPEQAKWCAEHVNGTIPNGFTVPLTVRQKKAKVGEGGQMMSAQPLSAQLTQAQLQMQAQFLQSQSQGQEQGDPGEAGPGQMEMQLQAQLEMQAQLQLMQQAEASGGLQQFEPQPLQFAQMQPTLPPQTGQIGQPAGLQDGSDRLWVKGLPLDCTDDMLKQVFQQVAPVLDCKVLPQKYINNPDRAGLVRMSSAESARWCIENMSGTTPSGFTMPVTIRYGKQDSVKASMPILGLGQLPQHLPPQEVPDLTGVLAQALHAQALQSPELAQALLSRYLQEQPAEQAAPQFMEFADQPKSEDPDQTGGFRALVRGLPPQCDDCTLALFFAQFGRVHGTEVVGADMGVVTFEAQSGLYAAIANATNNVIDGHLVSVVDFDVATRPQPAPAASLPPLAAPLALMAPQSAPTGFHSAPTGFHSAPSNGVPGVPTPGQENGVWIRGLPLEYDEAALVAFFEQYGTVLDAKILPRKYPHNPDQAGLVRMATPELAQAVIETLNGQTVPGFPMTLVLRISTATAPPGRGVKRPLGGM